MPKSSALVLFFVIACVLAACDSQQIATNQVDSKGLVSYFMPEGWTNSRISSGNHYTRVGRPKDPTVMSVQTVPGPNSLSIEQIIENRKGKLEMQGFTEVRSSDREERGFVIWEGVFEGERRGEAVIWHDHLFFSHELSFEVNLIARQQEFEEYLPDLLTVLESVRLAEPGQQE
jgi:hypothetical protein